MRSSLRKAWVERINSISSPCSRASLLGVVSDLLPQGLGKARIVEQADAVTAQVGRHARGIADTGQRARDDEAVIARDHARDLRGVAVGQQGHGSTLLSACDDSRRRSAMSQHTPFFGFGFAELGFSNHVHPFCDRLPIAQADNTLRQL